MHDQQQSRSLTLILTLLWSLIDLVQPLHSSGETFLMTKTPKPCFWEMDVLPEPPLSQTEPSIPSLWLAQGLYGHSTLESRPIPETSFDAELSPNTVQPSQEQQLFPILETWFVEPQITKLQSGLYVNNLVTLVVNRINWNRERYMGQYVFVSRFASFTRRYGYNLRVCNRQGDLLAYYVCDFESSPLNCEMKIRSEGLQFRDFRRFNQ